MSSDPFEAATLKCAPTNERLCMEIVEKILFLLRRGYFYGSLLSPLHCCNTIMVVGRRAKYFQKFVILRGSVLSKLADS